MAAERKTISGRVVAVTGGARGIGRATAQALIRSGARVAIGDLDVELAQTTAAELGGGAIALELDVTDTESFAAFLDETERQLGPLDVLINNAGIMPMGAYADEPDDVSLRIIDINLGGVMTGTKLALKRFVPRGSGHIVNIASQAGRAGFAGLATYCASKHAVVGLSRSLADELYGSGVEISVVMPGVVRTELSAGFPELRGMRTVAPEDVAAAIVGALEQPYLNVHVPKEAKAFGALGGMPIKNRKLIERLMGAEDKALLHVDPATRSDYESRARGEDRVTP